MKMLVLGGTLKASAYHSHRGHFCQGQNNRGESSISPNVGPEKPSHATIQKTLIVCAIAEVSRTLSSVWSQLAVTHSNRNSHVDCIMMVKLKVENDRNIRY